MKYQDIANKAGGEGAKTFPCHSPVQLAPARKTDKDTIIRSYLITNIRSNSTAGISIVGMAGLGKTVLAKSIQDDRRIHKFFNCVRWVTVPGGELYDPEAMVVEQPEGKTLLIIDNLCKFHLRAWNDFRTTVIQPHRVTLLITTRDPKVALLTDTATYHLQKLSDQDCKVLIQNRLLPLGRSLQYHVSITQMARKCAGLPLVADVLGMAAKSECGTQEEGLQDAITRFARLDLWGLKVFQEEIVPNLRFIDHTLPAELNKMLVYFALFPPGHQFDKYELSGLWMAEGFVPCQVWTPADLENAAKYFDDLVSRSLLHCSLNDHQESDDIQKTYQIHEFTHRFAQSVPSNVCYQVTKGWRELLLITHPY